MKRLKRDMSEHWSSGSQNGPGGFLKPLGLCLILHLCAGQSQAQVPTNGSFENGLTAWTTGGTARVDSLTAADLGNQVAPSNGTRYAFLSTGPGNTGGVQARVDGNTLNDFNIATLSTNLNFDFFPAVVSFDYAFPSSEQDQPFNFDDIFDVLVNGNRVLSGSTNKPGGSSNFPDAPASLNPLVNVAGGGATAGSLLRFGIPALSNYCGAIPGAIPGNNSIPLQFRVADQADTNFDSGLVVDNVRVLTNCAPPGTISLRQMTLSSDGEVELKDGTLIARLAQNRSPVSDSTGAVQLFIANADYGGGNPSFLDQVYMMSGGGLTRLTNFTGDEIQAVELGDTGSGASFAVFSARATPADNLEIFRLRLSDGQLAQITNTDNCDNTSPSINGGGSRIAFLSTCGSDLTPGFNPDGNREMVFWNNGTYQLNETSGCQSFRPMVNSLNTGRVAVFASNCNYTGANGDGNVEIFRYERQGNNFTQITNTTGSAVLDPVDINRDGRFIVYIAQDPGGRYVVYRYDDNTGTSTFQGVSRPDRLIINVRIIDSSDGDDIYYEALDLFAIPPLPTTLIGHINPTSQVTTEQSVGDNLSGIAGARVGGVPYVYFSLPNNPVGMNADGNLEIFEGRVE